MLPHASLKMLGKGIMISATWLMAQQACGQTAYAFRQSDPAEIHDMQLQQLQTLETVLGRIEKMHDVSFICRSELLQLKINTGAVRFEGDQFAVRLEQVLQPYHLRMKRIAEKQFAITDAHVPREEAPRPADKEPLEQLAGSALQLETLNSGREMKVPAIRVMRVNGVVTNSTGVALPGVTISVKGTGNGTITDMNGKFSISVPDGNAVLTFSYVGYLVQQVPVNNRQDITVLLQEDTRELNQVVVVGYGQQKKVNLTGAVGTVGGKEIASRPATSVSGALQGLVPGLTATSNTGMPGATGATLRIRGVGTLNNSNPFLLIDGIPGDINFLNMNDIESVSVLKDAASSAIYGSRAANGVILVTTKKGKMDQKPTLSYSGYYGIQRPTAMPKMVGAAEYMGMLNEAQRNVNLPPTYTDEDIQKVTDGSDPDYFANTNWPKVLFKKHATQQEHNVSLNGGMKDMSYYLSYGRQDQQGLVVGDQYWANRNAVRLRVNGNRLFDIIDLDGSIGFIDRTQNQPAGGTESGAGPVYTAMTMSPLNPVKFRNGSWGYGGGSSNPVAIATDGGFNNFKSQEFTGNLQGKVHILNNLDITGQYGTVIVNQKRNTFTRKIDYLYPETGDTWYSNMLANLFESRDYTSRMENLSAYLNYAQSFQQHHFKLLVGYQQETYRYDSWAASKTNFVSDESPTLDLGAENPKNSGDAYQYALRSVFGRLNYDYKEKYLLELNLRYDGSSRYAPGLRYGTFPSASVGWRFTRESFLVDRPAFRWLNEGKLRVSYGELGNQYGGDGPNYSEWYPYVQVISDVATMPIGNVLTKGLAQTILDNANLKWEKVNMLNIGLDLAFLNNRLSVTADWFDKKTKDIQLKVPQPDVLGLEVPDQNAGDVSNKGWELGLSWNDHIGNVAYSVSGMLSDVRNKVLNLGGAPPTLADRIRQVGYPIDAFYGYKTDGLAQVSDFTKDPVSGKLIPKFPIFSEDQGKVGPGDLKYHDLDGDGKITADKDRVVIGNAFPRYTYSLKGSVAYKGLDFSFFIQGVGKGNGYVSSVGMHTFQAFGSYPQEVHRDRWTPEHPDAWYPRFTYLDTRNTTMRMSDYWLQNAAYFRLKNIQVGYTLPAQWTQRLRIQQLRAYVSADNLFTKTKFFYAYDPETVQTNGGFYPQVKTIVFGINVNFK